VNYVLDINVISELISKNPNKKVVEWLDRIDPNRVYLSVITLGEIRKGIEKLQPSKRRETLKEWLESDLLLRFYGRILVITTDVILIWGELTGRLEKDGRSMTAIDSLIAAIALQGEYCLVTRNERDFQHTGVKVFNPWKEL
jgi:tRNA(fMet)-specific endonuclease VapC